MDISAMRCAVLVAAICATGCAGTAEYMRSRPVTYFQTQIPDGKGPLARVRLHCTQVQKLPSEEQDGKNGRECLYVSADVSALMEEPVSPQDTDEVIDYLIGVSDMNCSNFMHRVFASKANMDFTDGLVSNLATSAATATAHVDPTVSAALNVANLVVGNSMDSFNSTYFLDKTFQALEAAINSERQRIMALIIAKRATATPAGAPPATARRYGLVQALSDLRAYDDACSIKAGLNTLVTIAETEQAERTKTTMSLNVSNNQAADARLLYQRKVRPLDGSDPEADGAMIQGAAEQTRRP